MFYYSNRLFCPWTFFGYTCLLIWYETVDGGYFSPFTRILNNLRLTLYDADCDKLPDFKLAYSLCLSFMFSCTYLHMFEITYNWHIMQIIFRGEFIIQQSDHIWKGSNCRVRNKWLLALSYTLYLLHIARFHHNFLQLANTNISYSNILLLFF